MSDRCDGRYPVPQTRPRREEPFEVTYRCGLSVGHDGPHGSATDSGDPMSDPVRPQPQRVDFDVEEACDHEVHEGAWCFHCAEKMRAFVRQQANEIATLLAHRAVLREALEEARAALQSLLDGHVSCGDPDAECPLQDAFKPWHDVQKSLQSARAALASGQEEKT